MQEIRRSAFDSPIGIINLAALDNEIITITLNDPDASRITKWLQSRFPKIPFSFQSGGNPNEIVIKAKSEILEYLGGKRAHFSLQFSLNGTPFQKSIWQRIQKIPYGQTKKYGRIAEETGNKQAGRAVGGACNKNPIPIIIPCHRVIGAGGELTGFGAGLEIKKYLLQLESDNQEKNNAHLL